jgi:hypothetical protein
MNPTSLDSFHEQFLVYLKLKNTIDVHISAGKHGVKFLSLNHSARKTIKENTTLALWVAQIVVN